MAETDAFGHEEKYSKRFTIGGGNIASIQQNIEDTLESSEKLLRNKERAEYLASQLNDSIIINGDGLDEEVLNEANFGNKVNITNDDEDNLMVSVLLKNLQKIRRILMTKEQWH